jgi:hypothetical protein
MLGVAEAITLVTQQCPNGQVRDSAQAALDAIERGGSDVLPQQVFLVKTAIRGWQGERAAQIHRSLQAFLDQQEAALNQRDAALNQRDAAAPHSEIQAKPGGDQAKAG